ncbi:MAG: glycosyltransferase family 39 protein [Christensenellaceae bacterium]|jgi:dolichyl-phosphate-mannose-protein mannosyltransferase
MEDQNTFIIQFTIFGIVFLCAMLIYFFNGRAPGKLQTTRRYELLLVAFMAGAFLFRLALGYSQPGFGIDVDCFKFWANHSYQEGYANFYTSDYFTDYPPLYIYILSFVGLLRDAAGVDMLSDSYLLMIKMPAIIGDILLGCFVYFVARKKLEPKPALFLSALILFNPALIMNSAVWGQMDVLLTLLIAVTVFLLYKKKLFLGAVAFALALLLKPQAVFVAPVLLFVFVRNIIKSKNKTRAVWTMLASVGSVAAIFFLVPLPFQGAQGPLWLAEKYMQTVGQYPQASVNAFNLYGMLGMNYLSDQTAFLGLTVQTWGFIFIAAVCAYVLWLFIKKPKKEFLFALAAFIIMGVFYLGHSMHERYLFPVPVLLVFAYIFMRDKRLIVCAVLMSAMVFINQGMVLYYYLEWLPDAAVVALSAIGMAAFVYTAYVITSLALFPAKELSPKLPKEGASLTAAQQRLEHFGGQKKTLTRRDGLVMLVISAVYAVVAFTNLGAMQIPERETTLASEAVTVQFAEPQEISAFRYYAGYGEGTFRVLTSDNGEDFSVAQIMDKDGEALEVVTHELGDLYKWHEYTLNTTAEYFRFVPVSGSLPILEMAMKDGAGAFVLPKEAMTAQGEPANWFDEQELVPAQRTYMTDFYFDELYHARTAYENIHLIRPYEWTHPPLGKIIIASGIQMFGMTPFGWRFMGTLTGVLMLPVIYILAKMLFKKTKFAAFATVLMAADFMHFAQTRIATIDSYSVLFIMLMYLFMYRYTQTNFNRQPVGKTLVPLFLCGLFFGLGAATKWLCIYAGFGLLAIYIVMMYKRYQEYRYAKASGEYPEVVQSYRKNLMTTLLFSVLFFIVIPVCIYLLSYIPYTMVTQGEPYDFNAIIQNQKNILDYHANLNPDHVHPFSSPWYSWVADVRPVLFFSHQNAQAGTIATLSTMGNPLIWWTGIVAAIWLILYAASGKHRSKGAAFLAIGALSQLVPWMFITREVYIYHYFATVPFLILLIVYWLKYLEADFRYGKQFGYGFVAACVLMFVFFYPVITGVPADAGYVTGLRWLESWPFY